MSENTLELKNLTRTFRIGSMILGTKITAVEDVNISLPGDKPWILSVVGESGSGKTTLARMLLGLQQPSSGEANLGGISLNELRGAKRRKEFRRNVQPIFQNPFSSFSARNRVDSYLFETAINFGMANNKKAAEPIVAEALTSVGLTLSEIAGKYPNQFSGGELQRISIARALITRPSIIIADEPVAMIDASLRMNIVNLFKKLKNEYNVSFVYITHDLSTAYYVSDYIMIMYRGNMIEYGDARTILNHPMHPYTRLLLDSIPRVGEKWTTDMALPDMESKEYLLSGCKFSARCAHAVQACRTQKPCWTEMENQKVYCTLPHNKPETLKEDNEL